MLAEIAERDRQLQLNISEKLAGALVDVTAAIRALPVDFLHGNQHHLTAVWKNLFEAVEQPPVLIHVRLQGLGSIRSPSSSRQQSAAENEVCLFVVTWLSVDEGGSPLKSILLAEMLGMLNKDSSTGGPAAPPGSPSYGTTVNITDHIEGVETHPIFLRCSDEWLGASVVQIGVTAADLAEFRQSASTENGSPGGPDDRDPDDGRWMDDRLTTLHLAVRRAKAKALSKRVLTFLDLLDQLRCRVVSVASIYYFEEILSAVGPDVLLEAIRVEAKRHFFHHPELLSAIERPSSRPSGLTFHDFMASCFSTSLSPTMCLRRLLLCCHVSLARYPTASYRLSSSPRVVASCDHAETCMGNTQFSFLLVKPNQEGGSPAADVGVPRTVVEEEEGSVVQLEGEDGIAEALRVAASCEEPLGTGAGRFSRSRSRTAEPETMNSVRAEESQEAIPFPESIDTPSLCPCSVAEESATAEIEWKRGEGVDRASRPVPVSVPVSEIPAKAPSTAAVVGARTGLFIHLPLPQQQVEEPNGSSLSWAHTVPESATNVPPPTPRIVAQGVGSGPTFLGEPLDARSDDVTLVQEGQQVIESESQKGTVQKDRRRRNLPPSVVVNLELLNMQLRSWVSAGCPHRPLHPLSDEAVAWFALDEGNEEVDGQGIGRDADTASNELAVKNAVAPTSPSVHRSLPMPSPRLHGRSAPPEYQVRLPLHLFLSDTGVELHWTIPTPHGHQFASISRRLSGATRVRIVALQLLPDTKQPTLPLRAQGELDAFLSLKPGRHDKNYAPPRMNDEGGDATVPVLERLGSSQRDLLHGLLKELWKRASLVDKGSEQASMVSNQRRFKPPCRLEALALVERECGTYGGLLRLHMARCRSHLTGTVEDQESRDENDFAADWDTVEVANTACPTTGTDESRAALETEIRFPLSKVGQLRVSFEKSVRSLAELGKATTDDQQAGFGSKAEELGATAPELESSSPRRSPFKTKILFDLDRTLIDNSIEHKYSPVQNPDLKPVERILAYLTKRGFRQEYVFIRPGVIALLNSLRQHQPWLELHLVTKSKSARARAAVILLEEALRASTAPATSCEEEVASALRTKENLFDSVHGAESIVQFATAVRDAKERKSGEGNWRADEFREAVLYAEKMSTVVDKALEQVYMDHRSPGTTSNTVVSQPRGSGDSAIPGYGFFVTPFVVVDDAPWEWSETDRRHIVIAGGCPFDRKFIADPPQYWRPATSPYKIDEGDLDNSFTSEKVFLEELSLRLLHTTVDRLWAGIGLSVLPSASAREPTKTATVEEPDSSCCRTDMSSESPTGDRPVMKGTSGMVKKRADAEPIAEGITSPNTGHVRVKSGRLSPSDHSSSASSSEEGGWYTPDVEDVVL